MQTPLRAVFMRRVEGNAFMGVS